MVIVIIFMFIVWRLTTDENYNMRSHKCDRDIDRETENPLKLKNNKKKEYENNIIYKCNNQTVAHGSTIMLNLISNVTILKHLQ